MDGVEAGTREAAAHSAGPRDERGRRRVVIERVWPEIDAGRFPIKRTIGEQITVSADVFADGHEVLAGVVRYRHRGPQGSAPQVNDWQEVPLVARNDDGWKATFTVPELGE